MQFVIVSKFENELNFWKITEIILDAECGPIFGAGADLMISNNCNSNIDSYSNLPHSYDGVNASCTTLFSDYNFSIQDYEVFTVANNGGNGQKSKHDRF